MQPTKKELSAVALRNGLIVAIIILFIVSGFAFYWMYNGVATYATQVATTVASAHTSSSTQGSLAKLQQELANQQQIATLAQELYAPSTSWQTQVIKDVNKYAQISGITITNFDLSGDSTGTTSGATTTTNSSGPTQSFTITFGNSVSYTSLLTFMTYINGNLPKMQITGVDLQRGSDANSVSISSLNIEVYVK